MGFFLFIAAIVVAWFSLKKIKKGNRIIKVSKFYREMLTEEYKSAELYDQIKAKEKANTDPREQLILADINGDRTVKNSQNILEELLKEGARKIIEVDVELIFKQANFKEQYYLRATHYFPELEGVYGVNQNGKIVWVSLNDYKEATLPETGERITSINRYLRQNAIE